MKYLIYFISVIALSLIVYNLLEFDFKNFFSGENYISMVMILAGICCLIIMRIMIINEKIKKL